MKDMTGKDDQFRGPAIRALCSITDVSTQVPAVGFICIVNSLIFMGIIV